MDKSFLARQLEAKLKALVDQARRFSDETKTEAKTGASRAVNLHKATSTRVEAAHAAWEAVSAFHPRPMAKHAPIGLGSIVEVEDGEAGKTLFIAPAGAGEELTGPDGDGFLHVVTPVSPLGRALLGRKVGDVVELMVKGELAEWDIVYAG
ncbi:MAG: GreA/GreB family elongation factor [Archangiaceae bacterium]|nr:GreA/GreB family elongation factor [Archangiaceae bacterium]